MLMLMFLERGGRSVEDVKLEEVLKEIKELLQIIASNNLEQNLKNANISEAKINDISASFL